MSFKLVSFDFDHTLTMNMAAAEHLATFLGVETQIADAEFKFRSGAISTREFTDATATLLAGQDVGAICDHMMSIPLIHGVAEMVSWLQANGLRVVINTVGYRDLLAPVAADLGFDDVSGVELECRDGRFTGRVTRYFPIDEKIRFAESQAALVGGGLDQAIAVGDGLSDAPLFEAAGHSIAFNADSQTKERATVSAAGQSCDALYGLFRNIL